MWIDASLGIEVFGPGSNGVEADGADDGMGEATSTGAASAQRSPRATPGSSSKRSNRRLTCDRLREVARLDELRRHHYGLTGIGFAISLNSNNSVYVLEAGTPLFVEGPIGLPYTPGERFRVQVTDNNDNTNTATVRYYRLAPGCMDGTVCAKDLLYTSTTTAHYPLRVDAIFREVDATLEDVTIVRIKQ